MFKSVSLPIKVFITFFPLFFATVAIISYINYTTTQEEMMTQVQNAATAQAKTIREAIVNMMITNEQVSDGFLRKIGSAGDIKNISILFRKDSLHLDQSYLEDNTRVQRLNSREESSWHLYDTFGDEIYDLTEPQWQLHCNKHIHETRVISNLSSDTPPFLQTCEEMQALVPFVAEKKCLECHHVSEGKVLAVAVMTAPLAATADHLQDNAERSLFIFFGFIVIALIVNAFVFRKFINTPLKRLLHAIEEIGKGKRHALQEKFAGDEFGILAIAFEKMENNLQQLKEEAVKNERLSALGQMASSIVHDFRNPITNISLAIDQLRNQTSLAPEKRERTFVILHETIKRIDNMMQELLDYSRGSASLNLAPYSVEDIAQDLRNEYSLHFQQGSYSFNVACASEKNIVIDKERIIRALCNLINNAEDALPGGGTISVVIEDDSKGVTITVSDNGMGIPKEIQDTLFEPFVTKGKKKGTGLGLASVKRIIELHNGIVTFKSGQGVGTDFIIVLPYTTST